MSFVRAYSVLPAAGRTTDRAPHLRESHCHHLGRRIGIDARPTEDCSNFGRKPASFGLISQCNHGLEAAELRRVATLLQSQSTGAFESHLAPTALVGARDHHPMFRPQPNIPSGMYVETKIETMLPLAPNPIEDNQSVGLDMPLPAVYRTARETPVSIMFPRHLKSPALGLWNVPMRDASTPCHPKTAPYF